MARDGWLGQLSLPQLCDDICEVFTLFGTIQRVYEVPICWLGASCSSPLIFQLSGSVRPGKDSVRLLDPLA